MEILQAILTTPVEMNASLSLPDSSDTVHCTVNSLPVSSSVSIIDINYVSSRRESTESTQLAVDVKNVSKLYGAEKALDNFSMKVSSGAIYSLLGSSGSGKTTVLSCIVGLKGWNSGTISVLEHEREANDNGVEEHLPTSISKRIGYMPQELALYEHLTVEEIMKYFGKLYGMSKADIDIRRKELIKLLELDPKCHVQIKDLSGGQKRRVSLALAFFSRPQLLLLDEPTVGLDPVLRRSIWKHLLQLVSKYKTTVLITTHYIEETRYSNKIGIMRYGRMLTEEDPKTLLSMYKSDLLQDAILQICRTDHKRRKSHLICVATTLSITNNNNHRKLSTGSLSKYDEHNGLNAFGNNVTFRKFKEIDPEEELHSSGHSGKRGSWNWNLIPEGKSDKSCCNGSCHEVGSGMKKSFERILAFSFVMWIYLLRQPIFAFVLVFMPVIQLFMTFAVVGKEPVDLKVAVINHEFDEYPESSSEFLHNFCKNITDFGDTSCELTFLSCPIHKYLVGNGILDLVLMDNRTSADKLLEQGSLFGYIVFPPGYSEHLVNRHITGKFATDDETLDGSRISVTLDKSHYLAYHLIMKELMDSLDNLSKHLDATCGFDSSYNEIPLFFRKPVFGRLDGTHQDSIMPAIVAQILFEILYGIAPMILIKDLGQGTFDRATLAGLRFSEFILGIFLTMSPILIVQSISCYFVLEYGLNFGVRGSVSLFLFLCILAGLCGQSFGIFMGILVKSEFALIVSAIMVIPLFMTCSGTLWPLESHPYYLKVIYYIFPSAPIVASLRSVINRGVGITHSLVWPGVLNTLFYSVAFWMLSIYGGFKGVARR